MLDAKQLYDIFSQEAKQEGMSSAPWDTLGVQRQLIWGRFCRRLQREHKLEGRESSEQIMERLKRATEDL